MEVGNRSTHVGEEMRSLGSASDMMFRKAKTLGPRLVGRMSRTLSDPDSFRLAPPVLANSFPKSGTHMLLQILCSLPKARYFQGFIASAPSRPNIVRPIEIQLQLIDRVAPREVIPGHVHFDPRAADLLSKRNFVHYFIYRDPRDVCVSEMFYLGSMNYFHSLHRDFADEQLDQDQKLLLAIEGLKFQRRDALYPNIAERFHWYRGWKDRPDVCAVRYEDFRGGDIKATVNRIVEFYQARTNYDFDMRQVANSAISAIAPERSHTFRSGVSGEWKQHFKPVHKERMKELAGELLIELGYEQNLSW